MVRWFLWFVFFLAFARISKAQSAKKVSVKEVVFDSPVADIVWLGKDNRIVLLRTQKGRLYRSTNGGDMWNDITDALQVKQKPKAKTKGGFYSSDYFQSDSSSEAASDTLVTLFVEQVVANPNDPMVVMVVGAQRNHFISEDGGLKWRVVKQKSPIHSFLFHPTKPSWALLSTWTDSCSSSVKRKNVATVRTKSSANLPADDSFGAKKGSGPCQHMLYITKDMGRTFTLVTSYVVQFNWGDVAHKQQDRIYFTHYRYKSGDQPKLTMWSSGVDFSSTDDDGQSTAAVLSQGNKFLVSNGFVFVAKLVDLAKQEVALMVSNDGGFSFFKARLPVTLSEKSYTILDTSEGAVMLHVNHGEMGISFAAGAGAASAARQYGSVGTVYVSDAKGVKYTRSLPNNVRAATGDCEFDKVLGLEGVYLANFKNIDDEVPEEDRGELQAAQGEDLVEVEGSSVDRMHRLSKKGKEESMIRTVITFDKGGVWSYLKPPKVDSLGVSIDCPRDRCWLHLHGVTNFRNYAPFYSLENAIGIVMGTGNVGPYLRFEADQVNTYLSRDGGLNWIEAHKGAFVYEFGDHGGLVLMADDVTKTKQVVFSWNEGQSWYDFDLSDQPMEVDNIITEPNSTSTKFLLYGTRNDAGVLYHLDFDALGQPQCRGVWAADSVSSDYETWSPSDGSRTGENSDQCLLGKQLTYTRRKQTSECFNGEAFERPVVRKVCECTNEDFVCEIGFARKIGSTECRPVDVDNVLTDDEIQCTSSGYYWANAYRKVVGDVCEGGWIPQPYQIPCPPGSAFSWGAWGVLWVLVGALGIAGLLNYCGNSRISQHFRNFGIEKYGGIIYKPVAALAGSKKDPFDVSNRFGSDDDFDPSDGDEEDHRGAPQLANRASGSARRRGERTAHMMTDGLDEDDLEEAADNNTDLLGGTLNETSTMRSGGLQEATENVPRLAPPKTSSGLPSREEEDLGHLL